MQPPMYCELCCRHLYYYVLFNSLGYCEYRTITNFLLIFLQIAHSLDMQKIFYSFILSALLLQVIWALRYHLEVLPTSELHPGLLNIPKKSWEDHHPHLLFLDVKEQTDLTNNVYESESRNNFGKEYLAVSPQIGRTTKCFKNN